MNSIYHGETYDARAELAGWCEPGTREAGNSDWREVTARPARVFPRTMTARLSPPVRRIEEIKRVSVRSPAPGVHIYDLGQNMVGWVKLRVRVAAGAEIKLRFAEMLDAEGNLFTANLRAAKATAIYIAKGDGTEEWEPRFTYFGFRYVELSGVEEPLDDAVTAVVVHTDLSRTCEFTCSDPLLNQLFSNALWSQKGNFLELPTDCPQRDERAGWTGDAQVFAPTALYNMDAGAFYRQWLFSVRDGLRDGPGGGYPDVAPFTGFHHGSAGWAEAGMIIPWVVWQHTGDRRVLEENLPAIQHALELMAAEAPDGIRRSRVSYGDWLAPGFPAGKAPPRYELIATAFYAYAADVAARIAATLDRPELAANNRALFEKARAAFQREYIDAEGRIEGDVQTCYILALAFNLVSDDLRPQVIAHLERTIAEKDNHLATGFLGTPLLAPVLTDIGRADLAYAVLQQTTFPGWLFTVKNGATTIWERWDSWTPEEGFNKDGMNSFNHYAYGSIVAWFYDTVAGIQPLPDAPGWKRFRVAPVPGGGIAHAAAKLETPYGVAASSWKIEGGSMRLTVRVPAGTRAEVVLPCSDVAAVTLDGAPLRQSKFATETRADGVRTFTTLASGEYEFTLPAPGK
jgi:alpha-L-rhamnosidase